MCLVLTNAIFPVYPVSESTQKQVSNSKKQWPLIEESKSRNDILSLGYTLYLGRKIENTFFKRMKIMASMAKMKISIECVFWKDLSKMQKYYSAL